MGNQQTTNLELDLAFLAGLIEGEGCFSLHRRVRNDRRNLRKSEQEPVVNYASHIAISNSDYRVIEEVHEILSKLEVGHYIQWHGTGLKKGAVHPVNGKMVKSVRAVGQINIFGFRRSLKLLKVITPYLRIKKDQAECLTEWIERRLSIPCTKAMATRTTTYDAVDDNYYKRMADLKQAGVSETTRQSYAVRFGELNDGKI